MPLRRRVWVTLGAVVVGGTGVATYAMAGPDAEADDPARAKRPVEVHDIALRSAGAGKRELPRTGTEPFSLLGVSWQGPRTTVEGTAEVRTRSVESGAWSAWQPLGLDPHVQEDVEPGMRGASEPLWVGPSDGVEVRVVAADGTSTAGLPKGLEVNLVDPGVTAKEAKNPALDTEAMSTAAYAQPAAAEEPTPTEPTPAEPAPTEPTPTDPAPEPTTSAPEPTTEPTAEPTASPSPTPTKPPAPRPPCSSPRSSAAPRGAPTSPR
ncbi:hypothetical protein [Streptomyces cavernicola]|uniref:hypothetical protein n=1 Tax=Streptomyces cavernicola TaxID=3043613 RepID=UPI0032B7E95F